MPLFCLSTDVSVKHLYNEYNELKNFSINARYHLYPLKSADLDGLKPHLEKIRREIAPYLR